MFSDRGIMALKPSSTTDTICCICQEYDLNSVSPWEFFLQCDVWVHESCADFPDEFICENCESRGKMALKFRRRFPCTTSE